MLIGPQTRALVTGASKGIGLATARALAARGATVGMVARGAEELERRAEELGGIALEADIADRDAVEAAVGAFAERAGGLDLLVANAGVLHYAPFPDQPLADAEHMVMVNVMGTIYTVKAALGPMLAAGSGHVVVVSSGAALRAFPWGAVYGATKAAERSFAEALRHDLSGTGVSVTTVYPGEVATELHSHQRDRMPDWRSSEAELRPEEVAEALLEGVEGDRRAVYVPAAVRLLALNGLAPRAVDHLLARARGGSAAPRRD
ncbi:MAG: SDR family NAD(P)-dependent oxidoreductase [Solirubrobacterales bacterium]